MGILVKLVGSGIGLASEALHNRKLAKAEEKRLAAGGGESSSTGGSRSPSMSRNQSHDDAPPEYVEVPEEHGRELIAQGRAVPVDTKYPDEKAGRNPYLDDDENDDASSEEGDEEAWQLDEASRELVPTPSEEQGPASDIKNLTDAFLRKYPAPAYAPRAQLPCPVILPQRRPRDKKRGFVRAYAPVLGECDIDQDTFLEFLKTFQLSCKEDKWLQVVNLSAGIVSFVPGPITMGVSIAVQFAVGVAMEVQRRARSNTFLDQMNNEFFKPRGLYCLVMTYKPDSTATHERVDINKTIMNYSNPESSTMRQTMRNLRLSSGKTYGELELPESAPLIFPALERLADDPTEEGQKKQAGAMSNKKFVADYFDRRAQAKYAAETPGGKLAVTGGQPEFHSRYADPNHPASSGSLISLITGGHVNPQAGRNQKRIARRQRKAYRRGEPITEQTGKRREGIVKRVLKKDVLYLMIVDLPTDAETQVGRTAVAIEDIAQRPGYGQAPGQSPSYGEGSGYGQTGPPPEYRY